MPALPRAMDRVKDTVYYRVLTTWGDYGKAPLHIDDRKVLTQLQAVADKVTSGIVVYPKCRPGGSYDGWGGGQGNRQVWLKIRGRDFDSKWHPNRNSDKYLLDLLAHELAHCTSPPVRGVKGRGPHGKAWKAEYVRLKARIFMVNKGWDLK